MRVAVLQSRLRCNDSCGWAKDRAFCSWSRPASLATKILTREKAAVEDTDASRTQLNLALAYAGRGRETASSGHHEMGRQAAARCHRCCMHSRHASSLL